MNEEQRDKINLWLYESVKVLSSIPMNQVASVIQELLARLSVVTRKEDK